MCAHRKIMAKMGMAYLGKKVMKKDGIKSRKMDSEHQNRLIESRIVKFDSINEGTYEHIHVKAWISWWLLKLHGIFSRK